MPKDVNILIVDDEENIRDLLESVFSSAGFNVFSAENGLKALEAMRTSRVDCILTDIRMPKCDGIQLLAHIEILKLEKPVPLVFVMTGACELPPEDLIKRGAIQVFAKPFDRHEVIKTIKNSLGIQ